VQNAQSNPLSQIVRNHASDPIGPNARTAQPLNPNVRLNRNAQTVPNALRNPIALQQHSLTGPSVPIVRSLVPVARIVRPADPAVEKQLGRSNRVPNAEKGARLVQELKKRKARERKRRSVLLSS